MAKCWRADAVIESRVTLLNVYLAACDTVSVALPLWIWPIRATPLPFAATEYVLVPVSVIQLALVVGVVEQVLTLAVTVNDPVPPALPNEAVVGVSA